MMMMMMFLLIRRAANARIRMIRLTLFFYCFSSLPHQSYDVYVEAEREDIIQTAQCCVVYVSGTHC